MKKVFIFLLKIGIIGLVYLGSKWYFSKNTVVEDSFAKTYNRRGSQMIHEFLNTQNISHEFEIISGADHWYREFWNYYREKEQEINGLFHLKFHLNNDN